MLRKLDKKSRGFTLIELLVVVLILSILMAVALPLYLNAVADSEKKTCRANLQTIGNAVQAARVAKRLPDYSTFTAGGGAVTTVLEPDLLAVPVCPTGGAYTVIAGTGGAVFNVHCSQAAHGDFQYGVDAQ